MPQSTNFTHPDDNSVEFSGVNYIVLPGLAGKEFQQIAVNVGFRATGPTNSQVLVHNGPDSDPEGPSVMIKLTDSPGRADILEVEFLVVTKGENLSSVSPMSLLADKNQQLEAMLLYDGVTVTGMLLPSDGSVMKVSRNVSETDAFIDLRSGAFNIGGGGCIDCNNFVGTMDYVKMFDCVAPRHDVITSLSVTSQGSDVSSDVMEPSDSALFEDQ